MLGLSGEELLVLVLAAAAGYYVTSHYMFTGKPA